MKPKLCIYCKNFELIFSGSKTKFDIKCWGKEHVSFNKKVKNICNNRKEMEIIFEMAKACKNFEGMTEKEHFICDCCFEKSWPPTKLVGMGTDDKEDAVICSRCFRELFFNREG